MAPKDWSTVGAPECFVADPGGRWVRRTPFPTEGTRSRGRTRCPGTAARPRLRRCLLGGDPGGSRHPRRGQRGVAGVAGGRGRGSLGDPRPRPAASLRRGPLARARDPHLRGEPPDRGARRAGALVRAGQRRAGSGHHRRPRVRRPGDRAARPGRPRPPRRGRHLRHPGRRDAGHLVLRDGARRAPAADLRALRGPQRRDRARQASPWCSACARLRWRRGWPSGLRVVEAVACAVVTVAVFARVFWFNPGLPTGFAIMLPAMWISLRFSTTTGTVFLAGAGTSVVWATLLDRGTLRRDLTPGAGTARAGPGRLPVGGRAHPRPVPRLPQRADRPPPPPRAPRPAHRSREPHPADRAARRRDRPRAPRARSG